MKITDRQRVDWLLNNPGFDIARMGDGSFCIDKWVCNGQPGNETGGGAKFFAKGNTPRACVDKFIQGRIQRSGA